MTRALSFAAVFAALLALPGIALAGPLADLEREVKEIADGASPSVVRVVVKATLRFPIGADGGALPGAPGLGGRDGASAGASAGASVGAPGTAGGEVRYAAIPIHRTGAGFVIGAGDVVLTAESVAEGAQRALVEFNDCTTAEAEVIGVDPFFQVAVLRIVGVEAKPLAFADGDAASGRLGVLVSGARASRRIALGVVSAAGRPAPREFDNYLEIDALVRRADAGAPFLDANGRVIGMAVAPSGGEHDCEAGGRLVPAADLRFAAAEILAHGRVRRGFLGVGLASRDLAVLEVKDGSPAGRAGIAPGDRIVAIGGLPVESSEEFSKLLRRAAIGEPLPVRVGRDGAEVDLNVALDEVQPGHEPIFHGISLRTIDGRVFVVSVGGRLARAGIRPGDEIRSLNGAPIADGTQILRGVFLPSTGGELRFEIQRGDQAISISVDASGEK